MQKLPLITLLSMLQQSKHFLPGILLSALLAFVATYVKELTSIPVMLLALVFGMSCAALGKHEALKNGIQFSAGNILKIGCALIGSQVVIQDLLALGWTTGLLLVLAISSTIFIGLICARIFKLSFAYGLLSGGAVAICGASAALAISTTLPDSPYKDRDTALTIIGVTFFSTLAMLLYPIIASLIQLDSIQSSIFFGGSIHNFAQVIGAAYIVSDEVGELASLIKVLRIAFLVPIIILLAAYFRRQALTTATESTPRPQLIPLFLVVFIALMLINSYFSIPLEMTQTIGKVSKFMLVIAMVAIGMQTHLKQIIEVGFKPFLSMLFTTVWIAIVILLFLLLLY